MALLATMNKHLLITLFLVFISSACLWSQGLRTSVCVVYPECSSEDSVLLTDFAKAMGSIGFTSDASSLRAYAGKSFGSGVLMDGLVLTNRHVVGYAKTAKLVFMLHDKTLTYEHCRVLSTSQTADIAAVELPSDVAELHSLTLSNEVAQDGEDILAAGFPGLNHEPSWQLTKGSVSNSILQVDGSDYIQHTAAIDPGSSGGPLLRKRDGKFEVIGLNTMKAFQRDRVGMAVNANDMKLFLEASEDKIDQETLALFKDVDVNHLHEYYRMLPDSMKTVLREMDSRLPMDRVLAIANYYGGVDQLQKKTVSKGVIDLKTTDRRLSQNKAGIDHLRDSWSISLSYDLLNSIHPDKSLGRNQMASLNAELASGYLLYGFVLSVPMSPDVQNCYISGNDTIPEQIFTNVGFNVGFRIGAHLPVRINASHVIVPRIAIDGTVGMMITTEDICVLTPLRVGVDYRYQFQKASLVLGAQYTFMISHFYYQPLQHGLNVHMGVAF